MIRKYLPFITIFVVLLLITAGYLAIQKRSGHGVSDPWEAIPSNAALVAVIHDPALLQSEIRQDSSLASLLTPALFSGLPTGLMKSRELLSEALDSVTRKPVILSFHATGAGGSSVLLLAGLKEEAQGLRSLHFLETHFNINYVVSERRIPGATVADISSRDGKESFVLAVYDRILLCSKSPVLLEDAVQHLQQNAGLNDMQGLTAVQKTAGRKGLNLYINYTYLPGLLSKMPDGSMVSWVQGLKDFASWTEADLFLRPGMIMLGGFTAPRDSAPSYQNIFLHQEPQGFDVIRTMPGNTAAFCITTMENPGIFLRDYEKVALKPDQQKARRNVLNGLKTEYGKDLEELFISFCGNQLAICITADTTLTHGGNHFQMIRVKDSRLAEQSLADLGRTDQSDPPNNLHRTIRAEDGTVFRIYKMPVPYLTKILFGQLYGKSENKYFSVIGDVLVFSNSPEGLAALASDYVMQRTLFYEVDYNQFEESLDSTANFYAYYNPAKNPGLHTNVFNPSHSGLLPGLLQGPFNAIALQFSRNNGLLFGNVVIRSARKTVQHSVQMGWKVRLDSLIVRPPWVTENVITGRKEILVQDAGNTLYMISNSGQKLWSFPLKEQILGDVTQVDFFTNRKLQYLFATSRELHLVDRTGSEVEGFPVKLPFNAVSPLVVADFENKRDYRLYLGGDDNKLWCLDKNGKPVKGWISRKLKGPVLGRVQFFRSGNLDYIVFNAGGFLQVLNRKGEERIRLNEPLAVADNPLFMENKSRGDRLLGLNALGEPFALTLNGRVDQPGKTAGQTGKRFYFADTDNNGRSKMILVKEDSMVVFSQDQSETFPIPGCKPENSFLVHLPSGGTVMSVFSPDQELIRLYYMNGRMIPGFPVEGTSPPAITNLNPGEGKFNLLTGGNLNFLYNFIVE
jgi:hypothetical protein